MRFRGIFAATVSGLLTLHNSVYAAECIYPGEYRNDFSFLGSTVNASLKKTARPLQPEEQLNNPGVFGQALVSFDLSNQMIKLDASASNPLASLVGNFQRNIEAYARGKLYLDFKVCGGNPGDSITASVAFRVQRVGRMTAFMPGSTATFATSMRLMNLSENRVEDYRQIDNLSYGGLLGNWKIVAKIPFPIPESTGAEVVDIETFVVQLRHGQEYRMELFAAARSISGYTPNPVTTPFASVNFLDPLLELGFDSEPGVKLVDFAIDVASDNSSQVAALQSVVTSLQAAVSSLSQQFEALDPSVVPRVLQLEESSTELEQRIVTVEEGAGEFGQRIGSLEEAQANATAERDALLAQIEDLRAQLESVKSDIQQFHEHTHNYLTGKGDGHNNVQATTTVPLQ